MNEGIACGKRLLPLPSDWTLKWRREFNLALAHLGYQGGPHECFVAALRATELFRSLGDTFRLIDCLIWTVMVGTHRGESQHREAALAEAEALIDDDAPARQRAALALAHARHLAYVGDYEAHVMGRTPGCDLPPEWARDGRADGLTTAAWYGCALGHVDEAIPLSRLQSPRFAASTHPMVPALRAVLANAYALRGDRDLRFPLAGRGSPPATHADGGYVGAVYGAAARAAARIRTVAAMLIGFFDVEVKRTQRLCSVHYRHARSSHGARAMALGTALAQQSAAEGARLTEEQAIALMFDSTRKNAT